ncbi:MAG TPA: ATP-binding protein [Polyangia bacterium]|nr:ATP-binding protein [Polyangia bacterium]
MPGPRVFERRFRAVSLLKAGQGIETWLGTDGLGQGPIIIKSVVASTFPASAQHRLRNQARVLAEVQSPWVNSPIHVGVDGQHLYMVMPFVHGVTLEERLRGGPLDVRDVLRLGICLLTGLAEIHRRGVLHRDLKPSNIVLNEGTVIKRATLSDFWIARSDRIGHSLRDQPVAVIRHLSPERAGLLEANVDERSDLYSAGAVLFESLAGRPVFTGTTISELVRQHMSEPPPELRALGLSVPRALDGILQRLLQKDPRDRYHSADGVLADLMAVQQALEGGDAEPMIVIGSRDQRLTITEPAFTGRGGELRALEAEVELARRGQGRLVLLEAESGGGKTRLLDELMLRLGRQAWILRGQGVVDQAARPFQMLAGFAEQLLVTTRADPAYAQAIREGLGDERGAALAALPELASILERSAAPDDELLPEAFGEARTVSALSSLLDALGNETRPTLIVLDDAQWADEQTIKLLQYWQQRRRPGRGRDHVSIIVAFRSEEVPSGHALRALETATSLMLAPLLPDDIRRMAESMAGPLPEDALKVAETLSGGSPFMVSAVLRGMVECGALVPALQRWRVEPMALDDVRSSRQAAVFLGRRLERLPAPALELLGVGAVLGKEFDLDFAAALAGQSVAAATAALEQVRRRHIVWIRGESARCVFVHDKLREALLTRLGEPARRALHGKAAVAIEARDRERCFEIAYHYDAAGEPERALPYALSAGDSARARHALAVAEQQYRIAARGSTSADAPTRMRVAEGLGDILLLRGQYDPALEELGVARQLAAGAFDRARLEGKLGDLAFKRGDIENACHSIEKALRFLGRAVPGRPLTFLLRCLQEVGAQVLHTLLPRLFLARRPLAGAEAELLAIRLYSRLAHAYWFGRGRVACAWAHLRGMNLAERFAPTAELAQAYSEHAPVVTMIPAFKRGIAYARKSLAIRRDLGDVWGQGQSLNFYGVVLYGASRFAECVETCTEAMRLLERTGDRWELNTAAWHVAFSLYRMGDLRGALTMAQRIYRDGVAIGDAQATGISLGAWSKATRGNVPEEAITRELSRMGADVHTAAELLQAEALRQLRLGRPGDAVTSLERADKLIVSKGFRQEYVSPVLPWLVTALRTEAEAVPIWAPRKRRRLLKKAARVSRRALWLARSYQNNLPHALREQALLASAQGHAGRALVLLQESRAVAERQGALYELAQTRLAAAMIAAANGEAGLDAEVGAARQAVEAIEGPNESAVGGTGDVTLSLVQRFDQIVDQGRNIASALSKEAVIVAAQEAGLTLLRGDQCLIIEIERTEEGVAVAHVPEKAGAVSRSIISRAIDEAKPLLVADVDGWGGAGAGAHGTGGGRPEALDQSIGVTGARSVLCAPMFVRGWPVACLYVTHSRIGDLFGRDEERLAQYITTLASAAWQNAEGFSRVEDAVRVRDEFLAIASHELKTPLTALRLHLEKIHRSMGRSRLNPETTIETISGGVEKIARQADRLTKLIDELLDVSRITAGHLTLQTENLDLAKLLREVVQRFGDEAKRANCQVTLQAPPTLWGRWDGLRVEQVVTNLLTNAVKYGPGKPIEVRVATGPGVVQIEVQDQGIGLDPRDAARIFDRFERAVPSSHYGGLGLGLYIARQIVEAHHGEIRVASVPDRGATFTVTLPMEVADVTLDPLLLHSALHAG